MRSEALAAAACIAALLGACAAPIPVTLRDPAHDGERVYELRICRANGRTCDDVDPYGQPVEQCEYAASLGEEGTPAIGDLADEPYLFLAFARERGGCTLLASACERVDGHSREPVELTLGAIEGGLCLPGATCPCDEVIDVSAGGDHTCAVTSDGRVYCWGRNDRGQLGVDPTAAGESARIEPALVDGLEGFVAVDVEAGGYHTCARDAAGLVRCWGSHDAGQLGHGAPPSETARSAAPVAALGISGAGTLEGVEELAAGYRFTCARLREGDVACWGNNEAHHLGRGESAPLIGLPMPDLVVDVEDARAIAAGVGHACAVVGDARTLVCWGWNRAGAVGTGIGGYGVEGGVFWYARPVPQETPISDVVDVCAGGWENGAHFSGHTCAIHESGTSCWGRNHFGQLGLGSLDMFENPTPLPVVTGMRFGRISAGGHHTCALTADERFVACWGNNADGQIGRTGDIARAPEGLEVAPWPASPIAQLDAGQNHNCVRVEGRVWCWGDNAFGQLGAGALGEDRVTPVEVILPGRAP